MSSRSNDERHSADSGLASRLSASAVEVVLATYPLRIPVVQDPVAEEAIFPSMTALFADLCYHEGGYPPRQNTFVEVFAVRFASTTPDLFSESRWPGTQARVERAYPSFVRELHLAFMLDELGLTCLRDPDADQRHGLDIVVLHGNIAVSLATYIGTNRARAYRAQKLRRHPSRFIVLDVPLDRTAAHQVGNFLLYSRAEARRIVAEIARLAENPPPVPARAPRQFASSPTSIPWWVINNQRPP
jgi:hypothetical protein